MNRIILTVGVVLLPSFVFAYNESVAAISFNPSRLGGYSYLKAVKKATLRGGVDATDADTPLNIQSKGTVTLSDSTHNCLKGSCTDLNTFTTIEPDNLADTQADTSAVVQSAAFARSSAGPQSSYAIGQDLNNLDQSTKVVVSGGTLTATGDSYIYKFTENDALQQLTVTAKKLDLAKDLTVNNSIKLGKITITPGSQAAKRYAFVERTTRRGKTVKVLAIEKN